MDIKTTINDRVKAIELEYNEILNKIQESQSALNQLVIKRNQLDGAYMELQNLLYHSDDTRKSEADK